MSIKKTEVVRNSYLHLPHYKTPAKMTFKNVLLILFTMLPACFAPHFLTAQNAVTIQGKVTDSSAATGLSGVSVLVKGSLNGVSTDANGRFRNEAGSAATLVFSAIGYSEQEVVVGNRTTLNIILSNNSTVLQSVIVNVGYGTQKRSDVTGAVASISSKEISELPLINFKQALQGRAPGIDVVANGTSPGAGKLPEALEKLNAVRERAAYPGMKAQMRYTTMTIDTLLNERARELAGECTRFFDLTRTGKLVERVKKYNPQAAPLIQAYHALRPIPQSQINLTSTPFAQNPGYPK